VPVIESNDQHYIEPVLICIPDMTGFTRFMSETDIDFSRKVIPPLLQTIINSNVLGLKLSEIEGDAVLFYRTGPLPSLNELVEQCKMFYVEFGHRLNRLRLEHADDFHKNVSTGRLGLKIIVHYGEVSLSPIGDRIKLIGEDVIIAHRLLKNSISDHEYLLLTEKYLGNYNDKEAEELLHWAELSKGSDEYDHLGKVNYRYISLESLFTSASGSGQS
jgi:hypothetical protein